MRIAFSFVVEGKRYPNRLLAGIAASDQYSDPICVGLPVKFHLSHSALDNGEFLAARVLLLLVDDAAALNDVRAAERKVRPTLVSRRPTLFVTKQIAQR